MKKVLTLIFTLVCSVSLISCSLTDISKSQSQKQSYTGYLSIEGNTLQIDDFEFQTSKDQARVQQLGITDTDMPNGYYIHNQTEDVQTFAIDENTQYTFYDTSNLFIKEEDDKRYTTADKQQFKAFLYRDNEVPLRTPFEIETEGGRVIAITEIFVN
ncbi:hypothetical protein D3C74_03790 [compost metagenome]